MRDRAQWHARARHAVGARRCGAHAEEHQEEPRDRDRLPQRNDRRADRSLRRGHGQPAVDPGGLSGIARRWYRRRRLGGCPGGVGFGRTAVVGARRRWIRGLLRRSHRLGAGLRRPRNRPRGGRRELPALDQRRRSRRTHAQRASLGTVDRRPGHSAAARARAQRPRAHALARPVRPRGGAGRGRFRHQPPDGRRHHRLGGPIAE